MSDEAGHNFTFTSPQAVALAEREKFEAELTNIIAHNRTGTAPPPPGPTLAAVTPVPGTPTSARPRPVGTPARPTPQLSRASTSRAPSVASDSRGTPVSDPTHDFRLRKKVLLSTPDLAQLHRELVMGGQISENEFWEGREVKPCSLSIPRFSSLTCDKASAISSSRRRRSEEGQARSAR